MKKKETLVDELTEEFEADRDGRHVLALALVKAALDFAAKASAGPQFGPTLRAQRKLEKLAMAHALGLR